MTAKSVYNKEVSPYRQALVASVLQLIVLGITRMLMSGGQMNETPTLFWEIAFTIMMTYMLFSAMLSFPYKKRGEYFYKSIIGYVVVAFSGGFLADWLSGISMDEAGSFRWLYLLLTFCYLVFLSIANAMWKIIEMAKKQDSRLMGDD